MKLSELKFDGTDTYIDDNILINSYKIFCTDEFLKIINISSSMWIYINQYKIQLTTVIRIWTTSKYTNQITFIVEISQLHYTQICLNLIKTVVSKYQNYIRKQKLHEIIRA